MKLFKNNVISFLIPLVGYYVLKFIYLTLKKEFIIKGSIAENEPIIISCWHGELGMPPFFMIKKLRAKKANYMIISEHKDGEYIAKVMQKIGHQAIRGSSTRGGARVLLQAIKALKEGKDIAITPDGPNGPRHSVADGIVVISQKSGAKIVAVGFKATRFWQFNSWDKFILPKPFSKITFFASEPFSLEKLDKNDAKKEVLKQMEELKKI